MRELLRKIPRMDDLLGQLRGKYPEIPLKEALRVTLDEIREDIKKGRLSSIPDKTELIIRAEGKLKTLIGPSLKRVINGTGIIIHTNLGRAPLALKAAEAMKETASFYCNVEYNLSEGDRGERYIHVRDLLRRLLGVEDALIVNNNAAAVLLILNTLSEGREVIISRGELIEIGGSFRMPDVMKKSGAILREVGTTNRTYIQDFEKAINENTALLMKAHTSNYRIRGFTREVGTDEIVALGRRYNLPTYFDAGSGLILPLEGLTSEPIIREEIIKGFDLVSFSGDKILGGPQAGIIVGASRFVEMLKKNQLLRALRPDKITLSGLEATLHLYEDLEKAKSEIPTLRMIFEKKEDLKKRAQKSVNILRRKCQGALFSLLEVESQVGGGSFPDQIIPSYGIGIKPKTMTLQTLEKKLRSLDIPIIGRIEKDSYIIDMRTILQEDETLLLKGLCEALKNDEEL